MPDVDEKFECQREAVRQQASRDEDSVGSIVRDVAVADGLVARAPVVYAGAIRVVSPFTAPIGLRSSQSGQSNRSCRSSAAATETRALPAPCGSRSFYQGSISPKCPRISRRLKLGGLATIADDLRRLNQSALNTFCHNAVF